MSEGIFVFTERFINTSKIYVELINDSRFFSYMLASRNYD